LLLPAFPMRAPSALGSEVDVDRGGIAAALRRLIRRRSRNSPMGHRIPGPFLKDRTIRRPGKCPSFCWQVASFDRQVPRSQVQLSVQSGLGENAAGQIHRMVGVCRECGSPTAQDAKFCASCGVRLSVGRTRLCGRRRSRPRRDRWRSHSGAGYAGRPLRAPSRRPRQLGQPGIRVRVRVRRCP